MLVVNTNGKNTRNMQSIIYVLNVHIEKRRHWLLLFSLFVLIANSADVQAREEGGSIFQGLVDGVKRVVNPKLAEFERLYKAGQFNDATTYLMNFSQEFSSDDRKRCIERMRPFVSKDRDEKKRVLDEVKVDSDIQSLVSVGKSIALFRGNWSNFEKRLSFFELESEGLKKRYNEVAAQWLSTTQNSFSQSISELNVESNHLLPQYRELVELYGKDKVIDICTLAASSSPTSRRPVFDRCKQLVGIEEIGPVRAAVIKKDVEDAKSLAAPFEKITTLDEISRFWSLTDIEWRNYIEPQLPTIVAIHPEDLSARLASDRDSGVFLFNKQSEPSQKIRKEKRPSSYVSGQQVVPNPAYLQLQRQYEQVNMEYQNCNLNYYAQARTNPYAVNLCALYIPLLSDAQSSLSATSPTLTQKLTTPYEFDVESVSVSVKSVIHVAAYSSRSRAFMVASFDNIRSKDFVFSKNIHPGDESARVMSFSTEEKVREFIAPIVPNAERKFIEALAKNSKVVTSKEFLVMGSDTRVSDEKISVSRKEAPVVSNTSLDSMLSNSIVVVSGRDAQGTGFFVKQKYILTNEHVVENQAVVDIEFRNSSKITGVVIATDPVLDLALIAVPSSGVPLSLSTENPKAGDEAYALGHPQGLKFSLARGIISAVRTMKLGPGGANSAAYLQTDVAINPGNSGGPLVSGEKVVGVNSFKIAGKNTEGLGFALSSKEVSGWLEKHLPK
jgi:S1-C subfamily serine protease